MKAYESCELLLLSQFVRGGDNNSQKTWASGWWTTESGIKPIVSTTKANYYLLTETGGPSC